MISDHLKPSMVFIPAKPPQRRARQEEAVPLHQIDRRLWPGMRTVWYDRPAREQAGAGAGGQAGEQAGEQRSAGAGEQGDAADPVSDPSLNPTLNLAPALAPDPFASHDELTDEIAWTDRDVYPTGKHPPLPECVTSRSKKTLPECFALAQSRPEKRSPTPKEREVMLETLLQREMPTEESPPTTDSSGKPRTGRPPKIVGQQRKFLLHALGLGLSRSEVARRLEISPATITKLLHRDQELATEVAAAEQDGARFRRIYEIIFLPGCMEIGRKPHVGSAYFEMEKEYLIGKGLPAKWVRRLRARDLEGLCEELNAARAREKALERVEKEYAKLAAPERKSRKVMKIVRREFIKANGQPCEEIRWTVEERGPGRSRRSAWKELEEMPEL